MFTTHFGHYSLKQKEHWLHFVKQCFHCWEAKSPFKHVLCYYSKRKVKFLPRFFIVGIPNWNWLLLSYVDVFIRKIK
jgi:hypothetical protein